MLCKVTYCGGHNSTNNRSHQLYWGDQEMGTAILRTNCSQMAGFIHTASAYISMHKYTQAFSTCKQKIAQRGLGTRLQISGVFMVSMEHFSFPGWTNACIITSYEDYTNRILLFTQAHPTIHLPTRSLLVF